MIGWYIFFIIYLVSGVASYYLTRKFYTEMTYIKPNNLDFIFTIVPLLNTASAISYVISMLEDKTNIASKFFRVKR